MKKRIKLMMALWIAAVMTGCSADTAVPDEKGGVDEVEYVSGSTVLPSLEMPQPLFPDRDREKVEQLLTWVEQVKPVSGEEQLRWPKRSTSIQIHYKSGRTVSISHAWRCEATGTGSTCRSVPDRVMFHEWESSEMTVYESKELFQMLGQIGTDTGWMPMVKKFAMPDAVKRGESFTIQGNGWMKGSVKIDVRDHPHEKIYWSAEVKPDHGQYRVSVTLPNDMPAGNYFVSLQGNTGGGSEQPLRVE